MKVSNSSWAKAQAAKAAERAKAQGQFLRLMHAAPTAASTEAQEKVEDAVPSGILTNVAALMQDASERLAALIECGERCCKVCPQRKWFEENL